MQNKKAFTLVEIIISTIILTAGVFGIYKLLSINTNNLNNYDNQFQIESLFSNIQECIKSIWYNSFSSTQTWYSFSFWTDNKWCFTWAYNTSLDFSWVILDNREYLLYWSALLSTNKIDWQLFVKEASSSGQTRNFTLYK